MGLVRRFVGATKTNAGIIVFAVVIVALAALIGSWSRPSKYRATTVLSVTDKYTAARLLGEEGTDFSQESKTIPEAQMSLMRTPAVAQSALRLLDSRETPESLLGRVSVSRIGQSNLVSLSVVATSAASAVKTADAMAGAYIDSSRRAQRSRYSLAADQLGYLLLLKGRDMNWYRNERNLRTVAAQQTSYEYQAMMSQYKEIARKIQALKDNRETAVGDASVASRAAAESARVSPRPARDAMLGAIIGLVLGLMVVFLRRSGAESEPSTRVTDSES